MIVLAARPSMGKTAVALNLAMNVALIPQAQKGAIAIFSLEYGCRTARDAFIECEESYPR